MRDNFLNVVVGGIMEIIIIYQRFQVCFNKNQRKKLSRRKRSSFSTEKRKPQARTP